MVSLPHYTIASTSSQVMIATQPRLLQQLADGASDTPRLAQHQSFLSSKTEARRIFCRDAIACMIKHHREAGEGYEPITSQAHAKYIASSDMTQFASISKYYISHSLTQTQNLSIPLPEYRDPRSAAIYKDL